MMKQNRSKLSQVNPKFVLWVDGNVDRFVRSKALLEGKGYIAVLATTEHETRRLLENEKLHALVLDSRMSVIAESIVLDSRRLRPRVPIIFLAGYGQEPPASLANVIDRVLFKGGPIDNIIWMLEQIADDYSRQLKSRSTKSYRNGTFVSRKQRGN